MLNSTERQQVNLFDPALDGTLDDSTIRACVVVDDDDGYLKRRRLYTCVHGCTWARISQQLALQKP
jgi:hypothetical protein